MERSRFCEKAQELGLMSIGLMFHGFWFRGLGHCYLYRGREADNSVATL